LDKHTTDDQHDGQQEAGPFPDNRTSKPHANGATKGYAIGTNIFGLYGTPLLRNGYSPVAIEPGDKRPHGALGEWNRLRTTPLTNDEIAAFAKEHPDAGLGVLGGYNGLVPIDVDTEDRDILARIDTVLGEPLVAKRGRRGVTVFSRDPSGLIKACKFKTEDGVMLLEVLTTGQVVIPPTSHPETKQPYTWRTEYTLLQVSIEELPVLPPDTNERLQEALARWLPQPREYNRKKLSGAAPASPKRMHAYALGALRGECGELARMPPNSGRNYRVFVAGCKLGKFVHNGVLQVAEVEDSIVGEACSKNGLLKEDGQRACEQSLASGFRKAKGDELPVLEDGTQTSDRVEARPGSTHSNEDDIKSWPIMQSPAKCGLLGEIATLATANSEADPIAVMATFLVGVGALFGRRGFRSLLRRRAWHSGHRGARPGPCYRNRLGQRQIFSIVKLAKRTHNSSAIERQLALQAVDRAGPLARQAGHLADPHALGELPTRSLHLLRFRTWATEVPADDARLGREVLTARDLGFDGREPSLHALRRILRPRRCHVHGAPFRPTQGFGSPVSCCSRSTLHHAQRVGAIYCH
jgi:hypothetical protein